MEWMSTKYLATNCYKIPDKMIISIYPTDLIIVEDWVDAKLIVRNSAGNIWKHFFLPIPDFNEETFPFLVCSGRENFNLINV